MHRWVTGGSTLILAIVAVQTGTTGAANAADTYYIDESTDFTGNGCENTDLNDVTAYLAGLLRTYSWYGSKFENSDAWPQDFVESCNPITYGYGLDASYSDQKTLSVYAGHGNVGYLQWGYKKYDMCGVDFASTGDTAKTGVMRLGQMAGTQSVYGMYITSCTLKKSGLATKANYQWVNQQFGYHNSPSVGDNQAGEWFLELVDGYANRQAWLDAMEDKPGLFTGDNSPMVVSYGTDSTNCLPYHVHNSLYGSLNFPRGGGPSCGGSPPAFTYCYTLIDNGTSSACQ